MTMLNHTAYRMTLNGKKTEFSHKMMIKFWGFKFYKIFAEWKSILFCGLIINELYHDSFDNKFWDKFEKKIFFEYFPNKFFHEYLNGWKKIIERFIKKKKLEKFVYETFGPS